MSHYVSYQVDCSMKFSFAHIEFPWQLYKYGYSEVLRHYKEWSTEVCHCFVKSYIYQFGKLFKPPDDLKLSVSLGPVALFHLILANELTSDFNIMAPSSCFYGLSVYLTEELFDVFIPSW